jgi:hypothetical protein
MVQEMNLTKQMPQQPMWCKRSGRTVDEIAEGQATQECEGS